MADAGLKNTTMLMAYRLGILPERFGKELDVSVLDPAVSGYMFGILLIPTGVFSKTSLSSIIKNESLLKAISALAYSANFIPLLLNLVSVELPEITITTTERHGLMNMRMTIPMHIDFQKQFNARFYESQDFEIYESITLWMSSMYDIFNSGFQRYTDLEKVTGKMIVGITSPEMNLSLKECFIIDKVFPISLPLSQFNTDISNVSVLEYNQSFAFSGGIYDLKESFYQMIRQI